MLASTLSSKSWDSRRNLIIPGDYNTTMMFSVEHFVAIALESVKDHGFFYVALSGGSTPKAIYQYLCNPPYKNRIEWDKIHLFWSDERSVAPDHSESNYKMALDAGFAKMAIPSSHIHRMVAETEIEKNALLYEETIRKTLGKHPFDLIMLGMGEDGHTASLFPHSPALKTKGSLVTAVEVPQKKSWRMSFTYDCINTARHTVIYVLGAAKKYMLAQVMTSEEQFDLYPVQKVGTADHKALWIADEAAGELLHLKDQ